MAEVAQRAAGATRWPAGLPLALLCSLPPNGELAILISLAVAVEELDGCICFSGGLPADVLAPTTAAGAPGVAPHALTMEAQRTSRRSVCSGADTLGRRKSTFLRKRRVARKLCERGNETGPQWRMSVNVRARRAYKRVLGRWALAAGIAVLRLAGGTREAPAERRDPCGKWSGHWAVRANEPNACLTS